MQPHSDEKYSCSSAVTSPEIMTKTNSTQTNYTVVNLDQKFTNYKQKNSKNHKLLNRADHNGLYINDFSNSNDKLSDNKNQKLVKDCIDSYSFISKNMSPRSWRSVNTSQFLSGSNTSLSGIDHSIGVSSPQQFNVYRHENDAQSLKSDFTNKESISGCDNSNYNYNSNHNFIFGLLLKRNFYCLDQKIQLYF